MASINALVHDFKEHFKIPNNIVSWKCEENKFTLAVYCLEKDISVNKELDCLNFCSENMALHG